MNCAVSAASLLVHIPVCLSKVTWTIGSRIVADVDPM